MDLINSYKGRRVLVTGHTGFKGSWLSWWLINMGSEITGFALDVPSSPSLFVATELEQFMDSIHGDVRDIKHLSDVFIKTRPEVVFHLAAQPLVRHSYSDPIETYTTNVMGTVNVLECVRKTGNVRAVVNVTSDKCYENKEWCWAYRENEPMGGYDPYSSSKGCSELVTSSYIRSFFNPKEYGVSHATAVASARAGNVIGGGDWGDDRLIPDCAKRLSVGEDVIIRNPDAVRPWQHVLEPLSGYLMVGGSLLESGAGFTGPWNFGPLDDASLSVREVVEKFCLAWGGGEYKVKDAHLHEAGILKLDSSKSRTLLGWAPRFNTKEAIERTVEWYKAYYNGKKPKQLRDIMSQQIADYG